MKMISHLPLGLVHFLNHRDVVMASNHGIHSSASLEEYEAEGIKVGIDVTYQETAEGARAIP